MTATMRQPNVGVSLAKTKAQPETQPSEVAQALGLVQRLAEARSRAWCRREPTRDLTARLEIAWSDLRQARAMLTPHEPPAEHRRVERRITITDRRYHGRDCALDRFLIDRCVSDPGARVALASFAGELAAYVADAEERADLPSARQLARMLRARRLSVTQAGPSAWVCGVRLVDRDESGYMPEDNSNSQVDGYGSSREHHTTAGATGEEA